MGKKPFSLTARFKSFIYAFQGIKHLLVTQHNAWIHAVATVGVVTLGGYFKISQSEWAILALAIAMVWAAEAFNTALEILCDKISPEQNQHIGHCKDVAAAAVLFTALGAATCGIMVFWPYCQVWWQ